MPQDINGNEVKVGSLVKVLKINQDLLGSLSEGEARDVNSMLNGIFEVYEIDEYGGVWVEKWWDRGNGQMESHSLSLSSSEMELVGDSSKGS